MGKNLRIHPIWSQINGKIANKTIHPLCKNIDEAQIVALAFLALGQMQTFLAEMALAIPTQALRALRRRIEALQPCLFRSKMIFPVCSACYFSFASCSNFRIFSRLDFRPDSFVMCCRLRPAKFFRIFSSIHCLSPFQYICWWLIPGDTTAAPRSFYAHPLFLGSS